MKETGKERAMKIGILQTAPNNCEALDRLFARYPQVQVVHYVDECVWEYVLAAGGVVTSQCHDILAGDFNKMIGAGCDRLALLCALVKPGIETVRRQVSLPIVAYDDVQAERAVEVTPPGGKIAVIAMKTTPLEPGKKAVLEAAERAGKQVEVETICVESAARCLEETGEIPLADTYFERYLREHQEEYHAYVIPQIPLSRIMPRLRDMKTPVFDSLEPLVERLVGSDWDKGFEAEWMKK